MQALKDKMGEAYLQPQRPIGMGIALIKLACNCALTMVQVAMGPAVGPGQFAVETRNERGMCSSTMGALDGTRSQAKASWSKPGLY
jgi:hypothetical protein